MCGLRESQITETCRASEHKAPIHDFQVFRRASHATNTLQITFQVAPEIKARTGDLENVRDFIRKDV